MSKTNLVIFSSAQRRLSVQVLDSRRALIFVSDRRIRNRHCLETMNDARRAEQQQNIIRAFFGSLAIVVFFFSVSLCLRDSFLKQ